MKVTSVTVTRLFNLGDYEHKKIEMSIQLEGDETPNEAIKRADIFLNQYDPKKIVTTNQYNRAKAVLSDRRNYTIGDVEESEERVKRFENNTDLPF